MPVLQLLALNALISAGLFIALLAAPQDYQGLRQAARALAVARYDLDTVCLPAHMALIEKVIRTGRGDD